MLSEQWLLAGLRSWSPLRFDDHEGLSPYSLANFSTCSQEGVHSSQANNSACDLRVTRGWGVHRSWANNSAVEKISPPDWPVDKLIRYFRN